MTHIFINGMQRLEAEATIAPDDRGFRFGDGVFESIPVHNGTPYLFEYHMERLAGGLKALRIEYDMQGLLVQALRLLDANHMSDAMLRIQISRGVGSRGYLPTSTSATIIMQTLKRPSPAAAPVKLWLSTYEKISPRALPTSFKLGQGLNSTLARMEAVENGCYDALQQGEDGQVAETSSSNLFWRKGNVLHTPALTSGALAGVTRRRLFELSPYTVVEGTYTLEDMAEAEAVILCNASVGILPVAALLPRAYAWESDVLGLELNTLRNKDIIASSTHTRESLARK